MQIQKHNISGGLFDGSAKVVLADTPTDPRLITNAPMFATATILDHVATWHEAIEKSGLDFTVEKRPVAFRNDRGGYVRVPDVFATVRTDTDAALGIVKDRYGIVQNRSAGDMIDVLLDDGSAKVVAAGPWAGGALGFVVSKIPADVLIAGEPVQSFLVIRWSHDGSYPVEAAIRMLRPACANTFPVVVFSRATAAVKERFVIRHVGDPALKIMQARQALQIGFTAATYFGAVAQKLVEQPMNQIEAIRLTEELIPVIPSKDDDGAEKKAGRTQARRDAITQLFAHSPNLADMPDSAWKWVNAVSEYADHGMAARETKQTSRDENRARSIFDGQSDRLKRRAMLIASEFVAA
jgi:phage/plasmid-like protein (TIGR03299 family)